MEENNKKENKVSKCTTANRICSYVILCLSTITGIIMIGKNVFCKENFPSVAEDKEASIICYTVLTLGALVVFSIILLFFIKTISNYCIKIEKLALIEKQINREKDWISKFQEQYESEKTISKESEPQKTEKETHHVSYGSFEKIVKYITDCIAEI